MQTLFENVIRGMSQVLQINNQELAPRVTYAPLSWAIYTAILPTDFSILASKRSSNLIVPIP